MRAEIRTKPRDKRTYTDREIIKEEVTSEGCFIRTIYTAEGTEVSYIPMKQWSENENFTLDKSYSVQPQ